MAPKKKSDADPVEELVKEVCAQIVAGQFDGHFSKVEDALDERQTTVEKERAAAKKKTAPTPATKPTANAQKVPESAPKRAPSPSVKPVKDKVYGLVEKFPKIGGAKVKFVKLRDADKTKAVVKMETEKPGFPKGKQTIVPVAALVAVEERPTRRAAAKKVATKPVATKTVAKKKAVKRGSK